MLFKYLPPERIDVLQKLQIRFSPFESLNDPFESLPLFKSKQVDELTDMITKTLQDMIINKDSDDNSKKCFANEFTTIFRNQLESEYFSPATFGQAIMKQVDSLDTPVGILSLSRVNTNLLMWSHYAENGKGFVIELDSINVFFTNKNSINSLKSVVYSQRRMIFDLEQHHVKHQENIPIIFSRKPLAWAYEEEERLFKELNTEQNDIDTGKTDAYGKKVILTPIPHNIIKAVYIGYNTSPEIEGNIIKAIKENGIQAQVFKGKMSRDEYNILFEKFEIAKS